MYRTQHLLPVGTCRLPAEPCQLNRQYRLKWAAAADNSSKSASNKADSPRSEGGKPKFGWFNMMSKKSQANDGSSSNVSAEQPASPAWGGTSATDWGGQGVEEEARGDPLGYAIMGVFVIIGIVLTTTIFRAIGSYRSQRHGSSAQTATAQEKGASPQQSQQEAAAPGQRSGKQAQQHPVRDLEDGPPGGSRHSLPYARHTEPWGQYWNGDDGDVESAEEAEAAQPQQGQDRDRQEQEGRGGEVNDQEAQADKQQQQQQVDRTRAAQATAAQASHSGDQKASQSHGDQQPQPEASTSAAGSQSAPAGVGSQPRQQQQAEQRPPLQVYRSPKAVDSAAELPADVSVGSLRKRVSTAMRAAVAASEASQHAAAHSSAAAQAATQASIHASRAAGHAAAAQETLEGLTDQAVQGLEERIKRAEAAVADAEQAAQEAFGYQDQAAEHADVSKAHVDIAESQSSAAEKAADVASREEQGALARATSTVQAGWQRVVHLCQNAPS